MVPYGVRGSVEGGTEAGRGLCVQDLCTEDERGGGWSGGDEGW